MKNIVKIFGLLSVIAVIPGAMAATSRVSMISKASPRLPSIAGYIASKNTITTGGVSYLADPDCVNNYTDCLKSNDACGSGFEECTNNILLHAKMPNCLNVLSQCSAKGITSLFGTSNISTITTPIKDTTGEITDYTYPTSGSALGQLVTGAQIANQLTKDQCVKKYTTCLKKDSVCGADFELCTDNDEFKKQALACDSTLARCKNDGKTELFGTLDAAKILRPQSDSRLGQMIKEGEALAVNNAVATCNKVTDQCILSACSKNPNKCVADRNEILIRIADAANGGKTVTAQDLMEISKITTSRDIASYIRQECQQTIGSNRYCYMTVKKTPVTKESVLTDPENVEEVFDDMYNGEFGRFAALKDKISQIVDNYDAKIQDKCIDTMSSCAMRSCGGGVGSVCYAQSRNGDGSVSITKTAKSYKEIKSACRAIVDNDSNCQYAAVLNTASLYGGYLNEESNVFTTLFPEDATTDPIGIVAYLNSLLATSYNEVAIENLRKQCQTTALSCVKSMCGKDYVNCYRNRTDIVSGTYNTGSAKFDKSMNKVGGVLDYNIVIGLCMNTVKNSAVCDEHLKIAANTNVRDTLDTVSWGKNSDGDQYGSVREGWLGANSTDMPDTKDVLVACAISAANAELNEDCKEGATMKPQDGQNVCIGLMDESGCLYTEPIYQVYSEYILENAGKTLFQQLLTDVEKEVQAKYNAKLTKEQNVCYANNTGGVKGANDLGSTFMWVKLKNNKVPSYYEQKGLKSKDFGTTGDLYGAFCRAKITIKSDDIAVQQVLSDDDYADDSIAYFAVGDSFTCGSWLSENTLKAITDKVGQKAVKESGYAKGSAKSNTAIAWSTVGGLLGGGAIGVGLTESGTISGLLNKADSKMYGTKTGSDLKKQCLDYVSKAKSAVTANNVAAANSYAQSALEICRKLDGGQNAKGKIIDLKCPEDVKAEGNDSSTNKVVVLGDTPVTVRNTKNKFVNSANDLKMMIDAYATEGADATAGTAAKTAITNALKATTPEAANKLMAAAVAKCETITTMPQGSCTFIKWTTDADDTTTTTYVSGSDASNLNAFNNYVGRIEAECAAAGDVTSKEADRNKAARIAVPIATAVGGAVLGGTIAKTVLDVKREDITNEAVKQWMDEIGDHIHCYIGSEELGSFGDVIGIEIN